ncbi:dienelactone hydrolase family protein [Roseomonas alkaliterrae]|uniref:Carboxymethylenebutenolidase n=1 Tax=Neoroseomonas alkaliterrae TaxID=1452450 RepID=A0A840Y5M6_9PROT|nr:dienelactone hydrolase family protein [Neoroseomonas alkaliterrae]MBB5691677.1 carboxymethylenebutenolidase [Neoroseomonas alkaliterrae]MBR0676424.1 dienelactone hydrolase family protein [Neoroseomonas alkaliterrae]
MPTISLTAADGHRLTAYRAGPQDAPRALVVVQEIFGVNRHIRSVCDRFAAEGYAVIAPALFDRVGVGIELGYEAADVAQGRELRGRIDPGLTVLDVLAAAAALPRGVKRGIVGYCWGGTVAWHGATRTSAFAAASGWYGGGIAAAKEEQPRCPVQLHFGETDASIPMADVEAIRAAQPGVEVHVYGGGHGFGCDERGSFVEADYRLAQRRTLEFFARHL